MRPIHHQIWKKKPARELIKGNIIATNLSERALKIKKVMIAGKKVTLTLYIDPLYTKTRDYVLELDEQVFVGISQVVHLEEIDRVAVDLEGAIDRWEI